MVEEELDELEDVLIFDEDTEKVWGGIFDIATPEECSTFLGKKVVCSNYDKFEQ